MCSEGERASCGQPVWAAAIMTLDRFDQTLALEPSERLVEGARSDTDIGELLDVLRQRVPVFGSVGEAGQDQRRRAGVAAEGCQRFGLGRFACLRCFGASHR